MYAVSEITRAWTLNYFKPNGRSRTDIPRRNLVGFLRVSFRRALGKGLRQKQSRRTSKRGSYTVAVDLIVAY